DRRARARLAYLRGDALGGRAVVEIVDPDVGAVTSKRDRHAAADSLLGPGNQRHFSIEPSHRNLPSAMVRGRVLCPSRARSAEQLLPRRHAATLPDRALADEAPFRVARDVTQRRAHLVEHRHVGVAALEVADEVVLSGGRRFGQAPVRTPEEMRGTGGPGGGVAFAGRLTGVYVAA